MPSPNREAGTPSRRNRDNGDGPRTPSTRRTPNRNGKRCNFIKQIDIIGRRPILNSFGYQQLVNYLALITLNPIL